MDHKNIVRGLALAMALTAGGAAFAQVNINISLAPPAPQYESIPALQPGYVWAPGYWAWTNDRHVWVRGRSMLQRTGYLWQPDRWEQRDGNYYRQAGHWSRDGHVNDGKGPKMKKVKHDKGPKEKHKNGH